MDIVIIKSRIAEAVREGIDDPGSDHKEKIIRFLVELLVSLGVTPREILHEYTAVTVDFASRVRADEKARPNAER